MTQSIIIFVIIAVVQVIAAGIAKKKEAEKKAELENQKLGRTAGRPAATAQVSINAPKRDLFAAAQAKAQRKSDASAPRGSAKPITAGGHSFTSVVGSVHEVAKVKDLAAKPERGRFSSAPRPTGNKPMWSQPTGNHPTGNPLHMISLHASEGEATSAQLAKTVTVIHDGMLRKDGQQANLVSKGRVTQPPAAVQFSAMLRNPNRFRQAIVLSEIMGAPVSLRSG